MNLSLCPILSATGFQQCLFLFYEHGLQAILFHFFVAWALQKSLFLQFSFQMGTGLQDSDVVPSSWASDLISFCYYPLGPATTNILRGAHGPVE